VRRQQVVFLSVEPIEITTEKPMQHKIEHNWYRWRYIFECFTEFTFEDVLKL
jgi:hypothetical protein